MSQKGQTPALVILDFDGVLVDSEVMSLTELRSALHEFGVEMALDEVRARFLGASINKITAYVDDHGSGSQGFADRWYNALFERFREDLTIMPGARDTLDILDTRRVPYCIASGGSYLRLDVALGAVGLQSRFDGKVFSADLVRHGKPAPDLFLLAAERMGVPAAQCLVIEDSPAGGTAAVSAGMACIGFVGGSHLLGIQDEYAQLLRVNGAQHIARRFCVDELLKA